MFCVLTELTCTDNCNYNGICNQTLASCDCLSPYKGTSCEAQSCNITCYNGASCDTSNGLCICVDGFSGPTCESRKHVSSRIDQKSQGFNFGCLQEIVPPIAHAMQMECVTPRLVCANAILLFSEGTALYVSVLS